MRSVAPLSGLVAVLALVLAVPAPAQARLRTEVGVVRAVNVVRAQHGLAPLRGSRSLRRVARAHSAFMAGAGLLTHGAFAARVQRYARAQAIGETLAFLSFCDYGSPWRIVSMWLDSPPHRAVLLSPAFRRIGVGRRTGPVGCFVTADFASAT